MSTEQQVSLNRPHSPHSSNNAELPPITAETIVAVLFSCTLISLAGTLPILLFGKYKEIDEQSLKNSLILRCLLHFSVGTLLFDAVCHILPEAYAFADPSTILQRTILGIIIFFAIERLSGSTSTESDVTVLANDLHENEHEDCNNNGPTTRAIFLSPKKQTKLTNAEKLELQARLNLIANVLDNFNHGLSVGTAFLISFQCGFLASFSVLLHEIPHEFGDFAILLKSGKTVWQCARCQLQTAISSFVGGLVALTVCSQWQAVACCWLLPISAGGFIYVALGTIMTDMEITEYYGAYEKYSSRLVLFLLEIFCTLSGSIVMCWSMHILS